MATERYASGFPRKVAETVEDLPGGLRRFFRFSQLAVGEAGTLPNTEEIWSTLLEELEDLGIPSDAHSRIKTMGPTQVLSGKAFAKGLPASVAGMAGGSANTRAIKEAVRAAREAGKGLSTTALTQQWKEILHILPKALAEDERFVGEAGARIMAELKAIDPQVMAKVGSNQAFSAMARRGQDPMVTQLFNKVMKRPGLPVLPDGIVEALKESNKGVLPKVTKATTQELTKAGVKGLGFGRKVLGMAGRTGLGLGAAGLVAGFEINRAANILGRPGRAKKMALQGYQELGPSSSVEYLRDIVDKQEAVARRKVTMQKFEPEMFQEVVRVLSDMGKGSSTLTGSERRIGLNSEAGGQPSARAPEDVKFLLDQLFSQMGG